MSAWRPYDEWWRTRVAGRAFRKKAGKVIYDADKFHVDGSYRPHYDFDIVTVRLVARTTGRAQWVQTDTLTYDWVEVVELNPAASARAQEILDRRMAPETVPSERKLPHG